MENIGYFVIFLLIFDLWLKHTCSGVWHEPTRVVCPSRGQLYLRELTPSLPQPTKERRLPNANTNEWRNPNQQQPSISKIDPLIETRL